MTAGRRPRAADRPSAEADSPAGPGSRSYAFLIDWHIRVLAALGWILAAALASKPRWDQGAFAVRLALVPALAIYLLYHPVVEILCRGRTPGKRIVGLRVVGRDGRDAGLRAHLLRNALRAIDCLPAFYAVGLVSCFVRSDRARIGDLVAGTRVVGAGASAEDATDAAGLAERLLERWASLDPAKRSAIARALLRRLEPAHAAVERSLDAAGDVELRQRLLGWSMRHGPTQAPRDR